MKTLKVKPNFRIKIELHPNSFQLKRMTEISGVRRYAYNWALEQQMKCESCGVTYFTENALRKNFTEYKQLPRNNWLYNYSNDITKQAIKDCCEAFDRY